MYFYFNFLNHQSMSASFVNFLHRRFDFVNHSQFLNIFMNIANRQSRCQLNEIENPHQLIAAASHVTDCNCEINNHFVNFLPIKLKVLYNCNFKKFSSKTNVLLPLEI